MAAESRVRELIGKDRLRDAAKTLLAGIPASQAELRDEVSVWQGSLARCETQHRRDALSPADYARERKRLAFRLMDIVQALEAEQAPAAPAGEPSAAPAAERVEAESSQPRTASAPRVFLSYSRQDLDAAAALRADLERGGIVVVQDEDAAHPGEPLREFVLRSLRDSDATVLLLSEHSLLSDWVALETATAITALELWRRRRVIACYLDDRFLDDRFRLQATELIDERIAVIEQQLPEYAARRLDSSDLNDRLTRLYALRNQLGDILARLRGSLCLDLRAPARAASLTRLIAALRPGE